MSVLHALVRDMVAALDADRGEIDRLKTIIRELQRARFGRRSERMDADQLALGLEDLDADVARLEESLPAIDDAAVEAVCDARSARCLPDHLMRNEIVIDIEGNACPCCGEALHLIGESVSEMLDWVPAELRVLRVRRPKYACRSCGTAHQAAAPERAIAKGMATPKLLAQVLTAKFCDHLPLYRQAQIFARHGVPMQRSTLSNWVGGACWWLEPLHERLAEHVFASARLFADDTPVPVLDPGRGRTKTGRLWAYVRDDRASSGSDPPAAVYFYSPDRKGERPAAHLKNFKGVCQVDGYAGFEQLTEGGKIKLAACWAHARRKFYDVHEATGSPIAAEALRRIGELYAIEARIRGHAPSTRRAARRAEARPRIKALKTWLEAELPRLPGRGKLAEAIRYALGRWAALCLYLDDGRIDIDNNPVERAIRPVALGRKNHLFAGSDGGGERWATVCSLIETAKLNGVEPFAYLADVLERLIDGYPKNGLDDLMPWNWRASQS
ncbi:MAG TPA: IS66 family transposase [Parvularculaceae bacterium]|nr:IS66 family transposase [Parvularculaceae bacterium]HRX40532.1 IS66 family transposase [Parvularculaceae bacterium]